MPRGDHLSPSPRPAGPPWPARSARSSAPPALARGARFGFDPRSSRNALDTGYSANDLSISIPTYPFAELLALVGAASFFPSRLARPGELESTRGWSGKYPKGFHYVAWANPLPVALARIAATRGEGVRLFSRKAFRDKYSNLTFAVIDDRGISNGGTE